MVEFRIGQGIDIHAFSEDPQRKMVLAGVQFDGPGLEGHSDADLVAHACMDALLGAVGLGDLGECYPDTDEQYIDADSMSLLAETVSVLHAEGWEVVNLDCSVIAESPSLSLYRNEMERRLGSVLGGSVRVTGRRPEGLGSLGRGEGMSCLAVVLVKRQ